MGRQAGIGLIEILVTVLLLSVGFLAAAQMQVQGMRFSQGAYMQSQAYFMASDMMDRMRSNIDGVAAGHYDSAVTSSSASNPNCSVNFCNDNQLAFQDIFDWSTNLHPLLGTPNFVPLLPSSTNVTARGEIEAQGNGMYTVSVYWSEKIGSDHTEQVMSVEFAP